MGIESKALIVLVLTLICISFCVKKTLATTLAVGYGIDIPVSSWQSEGLQCSVIQIELFNEFKSPWYGSVILDKMQGKVNSSTQNGIAMSARLGIQKRLFCRTLVSLFGGFGALLACLPEIGDSGIVGHFGAKVKYGMANWELGYEIVHFSDPL